MLVLHIRSLDENTLAKKIYNEQRKEGWPGLAKETKEICEELGILDCNTTNMNKREYKDLVNAALLMKDEEYLRKRSRRKKKMFKDYKRKIWEKEVYFEQ